MVRGLFRARLRLRRMAALGQVGLAKGGKCYVTKDSVSDPSLFLACAGSLAAYYYKIRS